jgi:hypothetical protein
MPDLVAKKVLGETFNKYGIRQIIILLTFMLITVYETRHMFLDTFQESLLMTFIQLLTQAIRNVILHVTWEINPQVIDCQLIRRWIGQKQVFSGPATWKTLIILPLQARVAI